MSSKILQLSSTKSVMIGGTSFWLIAAMWPVGRCCNKMRSPVAASIPKHHIAQFNDAGRLDERLWITNVCAVARVFGELVESVAKHLDAATLV